MAGMFCLFHRGKKISDALLLEKFETEQIGIFETFRTYRRNLFQEEEHLQRFCESARTAGLLKPLPRARIQAEVRSALKAYFASDTAPPGEDAFLRMTYYEGEFYILIGRRTYPASFYIEGVALRTSPVRRSHSNAAFPEAKTTAYQNAVLAALEPRPAGVYEWVFLDAQGYVTEVSVGNIFAAVSGGGRGARPLLRTPPRAGILNGVTRRFVIDCASQAGLVVQEAPLMRHDLYNSSEAFLTNTSWEILPIARVDGRRIGDEVPGPVTRKLQKLFRQQVKKSS